ncbi:hypothetical protein MCOR29_002477 [Pyricularia oryzae]|nr:hypothetical protein MCOR19_008066 [Pyricularia oryzae]KAI6271171.1 hypothetical protein MCOR26_007928 [Pyricularia oryzae]KAI6328918.1 hypothetical protein MCOR29_002477 [Pyricularia oryzae]KAI6338025.1 hypothetical protein MCOR28_008195 [Pyricularia oryzae]KAI6406249.1 hypothetical protein MCOR20_006262 [Pyricularia oryzae]
MRRLLNWKLGLDASDWPGATPSGKCQGLAAGVNCSMIGPETLQGPVRWPSCALQPAVRYDNIRKMPAAAAHCPEAFREVSRPFIHISEKASSGSSTATRHPMNWTEGNLARHSRGGRCKELLQRQKQHFAKVRSGYFNYQKDSPKSIRDEIRSPTDHRGRHGQRPEPLVLNEAGRGQKRTRASETQFRDPPGVTTEAEHSLNLTSFDLLPVHVQGSAAKRQRLLNIQDWTGLELQKSAHLQSSQRKQNSRSPPQSRKEYRRQRPQVPMRHILGERYDALVKGKRLPVGTPPKPDSIRIRIGSQDMRIGGSSATVRPISKNCDATASSRHSSGHRTNSGHSMSSSARESRSSRVRHARSRSQHSTSTNLNGGKTYSRRGVKLGANSSSPSPRILQPIPCRMHNIILDPLLRSWSPNSDADDSLIAQVGRAQPAVFHELQEENNKWVQLMCPSDSGLSTDASRPPRLAGLNHRTLRAEQGNTPVLPLASEPASLQRPLINDRKSEYDAWIKSFLSSEDSDSSFNQQAVHDARLYAAQAIQCSRLKKAPSAEDSHEALVFRNPLGAAVPSVRTAASHIATHGSIYSSTEPDPVPLDSAFSEEIRECRPSASMQANRSISTYNSDSNPENHGQKHSRPSFYTKLNSLANESHSVQGDGGHQEFEAMSDASIRGNAPASIIHLIQKPLIRGPASGYDISSVVAEPAQSSSSEVQSSAFKFAAPKLFIGKRATQSVSMTPKPAIVTIGRGRKGRSRGDKLRMKNHERTSIRHLPNYYGDPIEEFSDEVDLIVCPKSSPLFGTLQTE